ncbi:hypothetical protein E2C01_077506 [Portunus trituberculatus]|uniref:Uncharacterized protein n=1 Tax=Portunus trituberculatus TaxID=210409 RepID=A0A5B7IBK8_PORTR|nr:hypothetical protein [Portunus trituberculatus]
MLPGGATSQVLRQTEHWLRRLGCVQLRLRLWTKVRVDLTPYNPRPVLQHGERQNEQTENGKCSAIEYWYNL